MKKKQKKNQKRRKETCCPTWDGFEFFDVLFSKYRVFIVKNVKNKTKNCFECFLDGFFFWTDDLFGVCSFLKFEKQKQQDFNQKTPFVMASHKNSFFRRKCLGSYRGAPVKTFFKFFKKKKREPFISFSFSFL